MSIDFTNRDYESDLADWVAEVTGTTITRVTASPLWGVGSCEVSVPATSFSGTRRPSAVQGNVSPNLLVSPNTEYTISVYVQGENGRLVIFDISEYNGTSFIQNQNSTNRTLDGTVQRLSFTFTTTGTTSNLHRVGMTQPSTSPAAFVYTLDGWQLDTGAIAQAYDGPDGLIMQKIRPDADIVATGWNTAPLWSKIEEEVADGTVITGVAS